MRYLPSLLSLALVFTATACSKTTSSLPEDPAPVAQEDPIVPPPPKQLPPPGEPGPFIMQMSELLPTQVFGTAATPDAFTVALQGDVRDITQCTETQLNVCFKGGAYITARMNPNEPKFIQLYESDTQSGVHVDDIAATSTHFIYAITDGFYAGDTRSARLIIADSNGKLASTIDISRPQQIVDQLALVAGENGFIACSLSHPENANAPSQILCEQIYIPGNRETVLDWSFDTPPRALDIAKLNNDLLIAWNAGGKLYAAFADTPQNILDLGPSTANRPFLAAGHEQFMIAWQDADTQIRVTKLTHEQEPSKALLLNGLTFRSIGGFVPTVPGFVLAFRFENAQQLAVIEPDLSAWNLVEGSKTWRQLDDYASIDIQEAHQGKVIWQTVDSLIVPAN